MRGIVRWGLVAALTAAMVAVGAWAVASRTARSVDRSVARGRIGADYGRLPLAFVPNRGQSRGGVALVAQGEGFAAGLTDDGLLLSTSWGPAPLRLRFLGARADASPVAERRLPGRVSYLTGANRARWRTGIPTFSQGDYRDLWPGIDAIVAGGQRSLEYTFRIAPNADPGRIELGVAGASAPRLTSGGGLALAPGIRQLAPHAYQLIGGRETAVRSRYVLRGGRWGIDVGRYDRTRPLIVDPTFAIAYSTYLGGGDVDQANAIAVDSAGEAFVTGATSSTDFATSGAAYTKNDGNGDAFVTKLSADGTQVLYTTYLGGAQVDRGNGIAVDAAGDAYVAGYTESNDFPQVTPLPNLPDQESSGTFQSAFVSELNPAGTALVYSTYLGGCCYEFASSIAVDAHGAAYVTGQTRSFDFPTTGSAYQTTDENVSAFITKIGPGDTLVYSTFFAGGTTTGNGIAVDAHGQAWIAGATEATVPTTANAYQKTGFTDDGGTTGFATELKADGSDLLYSTYLGGTSAQDSANGVAVDPSGDAFVTGTTFSDDFPTTAGALQTTLGGGASDAFVTEFHPDGSVAYSTYLGAANDDQGSAIATDGAGDAYVTGQTTPPSTGTTTNAIVTPHPAQASGFPLVSPTQPAPGGAGDAFLSQLAPGGGSLGFSSYLGGGGADNGLGIAADAAGNAYVTGSTKSSDFPTAAPEQNGLHGGGDAFVTKIGPATTVTSTSSSSTTTVASSTVTASGSSTGVPVDVTPPAISGKPLPGDTLHCSTGTWTNGPTSYTYAWKLAGVPIPGATGRTYVVQIADEASGPSDALTCVVIASNGAGAGAPATSRGVLVAVPGTSHCPVPTGRLAGSSVGVLQLGMTQKRARRRLTRFNVTQNRFDNFCLYAGWGIRVAYPTAALLKSYPEVVARRMTGRIVIALTANPFYRYRGTPPGTKLSVLAKRFTLAKPLHIGLNDWYIVAEKPANAIFKVRNGVVQEVGLVARALTADRAAQKRLMNSFKNG